LSVVLETWPKENKSIKFDLPVGAGTINVLSKSSDKSGWLKNDFTI